MACLRVNGQLNTAIRERSRILELQGRLKEWLQLYLPWCDVHDILYYYAHVIWVERILLSLRS